MPDHGKRALANIKNLTVPVQGREMDCACFGSGGRSMVVIPGLSDGLMTVKGRAWLLAGPYRRFWEEFTVYVCSRSNELPEGFSIRDMASELAEAMGPWASKEPASWGCPKGV